MFAKILAIFATIRPHCNYKLILAIGLAIYITGCTLQDTPPPLDINDLAPTPFSHVTTIAPVHTITISPTSTIAPTPTRLRLTANPSQSQQIASFTAIPTLQVTLSPTADTRLKPNAWRNWEIVPEISENAKQILINAQQNQSIISNHFSTVGDCQMISNIFLGSYARNKYPIPKNAEQTVAYFADSMTRESITAHNGLGINSILNPMFGYAAGHKECETNETPLTCELRINQPIIVLIGMGTNWKPNAEVSFDQALRTVVDEILRSGALPILATKADNVEQDWKLNYIIAQVAYDYDLPLVNVWRAVQDLPNHGLQEPPKQVYLTPDGWLRRNEVWLRTLEKIYNILQENDSTYRNNH